MLKNFGQIEQASPMGGVLIDGLSHQIKREMHKTNEYLVCEGELD
jgi:hypothetical protein